MSLVLSALVRMPGSQQTICLCRQAAGCAWGREEAGSTAARMLPRLHLPHVAVFFIFCRLSSATQHAHAEKVKLRGSILKQQLHAGRRQDVLGDEKRPNSEPHMSLRTLFQAQVCMPGSREYLRLCRQATGRAWGRKEAGPAAARVLSRLLLPDAAVLHAALPPRRFLPKVSNASGH